jgi:hypothetical protein
MTHSLRTVFRFWTALLFVAVLVQVGLAGYGAFSADHHGSDHGTVTHKQFDHGFGPHIALGYLIFLGTVLLLLLALLARAGRRVVLQSLTLALLVLLAVVLALLGADHPVVGILHPIDALAIVGAAGALAYREWAGRSPRRP